MRVRTWLTALLTGALLVGGAGSALAAPDRPGVVTTGPAAGDAPTWSLRNALSTGPATTRFGYGPDLYGTVFVTGDWDGDGTRTPGVVRWTLGGWLWSLRNSTSAGPTDIRSFTYGDPAQDVPIAGDWNGDGRDTVGVIRGTDRSTPRLWILRDTAGPGGADHRFAFDATPDAYTYQLLVGDWDGNGTDTPGYAGRVTGRSDLVWRLRDANSAGPYTRTFSFGSGPANDRAVVGNWDGRGPTGVGVLREEVTGYRWLLRQTPSAGGAQYSFRYGAINNIPVIWS